jgi:hypothetical protein
VSLDRSLLWVAPLVWALVLVGCKNEDTGECCLPITPDKQDAIPVPDDPDDGPPRDVIRRDPAFDCDALTCVSFQGGEPSCTRKCGGEGECPEGFVCQSVLQSTYCDFDQTTPETDDDCRPSSILPTDLFCVRQVCATDAECPDDFVCELISAGSGTVEDPAVRQCVKASHKCQP